MARGLGQPSARDLTALGHGRPAGHVRHRSAYPLTAGMLLRRSEFPLRAQKATWHLGAVFEVLYTTFQKMVRMCGEPHSL
jgi:hypothetical protein